jgi:uncharacterized cupin superfamily protein
VSDPNVFSPEWEQGTPPGLRGVRVAHEAGARELGVTLYELAPHAAVAPYHVHHANEELMVVLSGRPRLRTPEGERELEPGAVIAFPRGPDGAHQVTNPGDEPVRVLLVSTMNFPDIAEYPDTGALLAMTTPGAGRAFPADGERPVFDLYREALERGTSTS